MRLKRVKIFGFKTFADKTEFDLEGDMTAVVGPNGCGKSNLVDAILWGLGEGNAKHLRAGSSQDVIFSGSSRRKALGYAEVTLLFDNEDGALPIDTPEVSITRRLNRGGDSDYYINRQHCRLRDILDLLADSGLGRAGYAIVGQKEIDQALAASPEDRRAWVDEAAGVQRYRSRKIESLRRLESAHQHLERVGDILHELEGQREPLREEAEVARRYKSIQGSLREVETGLLIVEVARAVREVAALEERIDGATKLIAEESLRADNLEDQARALAAQIGDRDRQMDVIRGRQGSALTAFERASAAIRLLEQKLNSLDDLEENIGEESEAARLRIIEAQAEYEEVKVEVELEEQNLERVRTECSGAGEDAGQLRAKLRDLEAQLGKARDLHALKLRQEAENSHRLSRLKEIDRELLGIEASLPGLKEAVDEATQELGKHESNVQEAEKQVEEAKGALAELAAEEDQDAQQVRVLLAEKASLEGRVNGIEATIEAHEGLNQGARAVLESVQQGLLEDRYVPVGEAVETSKEHAVAIETALGGATNDLIVEHEADAKAAINLLKEHRLGRATFQPIPLMRPHVVSQEMRRLLNSPGVVGCASDLVTCALKHRPVIESLLGRVLVVENLDASLKLAGTQGWSRLVTLDGELVHHSGAVTGGRAAKQHYGLVQRKADLADLQKQLEKLDKSIAVAERRRSERDGRRSQAEERLLEAGQNVKALETEFKEARSWWQNLNEELQSTLRATQRLETERDALRGQSAPAVEDVDLAGLETERDTLLKQLAARSADAEQAETKLREAETRLNQAKARYQQAERRLAAAKEAEKHRETKLTNLEPERARVRDEIKRAEAERTRAENERATAEAQLLEAQTKKGELQKSAQELSEEIRSARQNIQAGTDASHQAELSRARADAKRANSLQRLVEEYGLSEEDALQQEPAIELPPDAAAVTSRLRRELKALGDVNLGAIEAYERLSERWTELTEQRADILQGIEQVEASIKELDGLTRDRFLGTFERLQIAFESTFQKLFGGGEGKIELTRPEDILETGIEIDVTLPGKKRQRLELLSGGERSMCATAFLFALLKVKPSPLVVLDEVDAPLDGRNVERYIDLLKEFSGITQFILITHNPTTIDAAPVWLGVTMQEPGVSTLVPARMPVHAAIDLPAGAAVGAPALEPA